MGNLSSSLPNSLSLLTLVLGLLIVLLIFLVFRWFVLWYLKINERTMLMEDIKAYTMFMAKQQNPEKFKEFSELYEKFKKSHVGKVEDPRK